MSDDPVSMAELRRMNSHKKSLEKFNKGEELNVDDLAALAKKAPRESAFGLLFGRGNEFERDPDANLPANFGKGSFSGVNVRDLKGNVVEGTTTEALKVDEQITHDALPLLRYINLPGGSIEIKIYEVNKKDFKYTAARTEDGKRFTKICEKVSAEELINRITSRAMGWEPPLQTPNQVREQIKLETSIEDEDNGTDELNVAQGLDEPIELNTDDEPLDIGKIKSGFKGNECHTVDCIYQEGHKGKCHKVPNRGKEHAHPITHADHYTYHADCIECEQENRSGRVWEK